MPQSKPDEGRHIDPTKLVRSALQNAASVASLLLTTECIVAENREEARADSLFSMYSDRIACRDDVSRFAAQRDGQGSLKWRVFHAPAIHANRRCYEENDFQGTA